MNYDTEAWYKLYIRESTEDRLLAVLNRALRDFLLRLAKSRTDATILGRTDNPGEDLARALGAHPDEAPSIVAHVNSMLEDGFLTHRNGRLWITNFVRAQAARTPGARRQKTYREKHSDASRNVRARASPSTSDVTGDVTGSDPRDVTGSEGVVSRDTLQERREDPRREDPRRSEPRPERARARDPDGGDGVGVGDFQTEEPESEPDPGRQTLCPTDLADRLESNGTLRRLAEQLPAPLESVRACARGFVATWTIGKLAGQKRGGWAGRCRQWMIDQHAQGRLRPPGAVEHEARGEPGAVMDAATMALMAQIGRGAA